MYLAAKSAKGAKRGDMQVPLAVFTMEVFLGAGA